MSLDYLLSETSFVPSTTDTYFEEYDEPTAFSVKDQTVLIANKQVISAYFAKLREQYTNHLISFTLEGLNLFMETGRVTEIPDFMYTYLQPAQRLELLKNILKSVDNGSFKPRIVRSEKFSIPSPICICAPNEQKVTIYYFSPNKGQYIFQLQELSLVHAFYDFLIYLPTSSMVYSEEESKNLLHMVYDKYKNIYNL